MKSKIKEVVSVKPWGAGTPKETLYHCLLMENGDKIEIGKKKTQVVGWELEYEIIGDEGQQEYNKAKSVFNQESKFVPNADNLKGVKIGHAISNGVQLAIARAGKEVTAEDVEMYANKILELAEKMNGEKKEEVKPPVEENLNPDEHDDLPF